MVLLINSLSFSQHLVELRWWSTGGLEVDVMSGGVTGPMSSIT